MASPQVTPGAGAGQPAPAQAPGGGGQNPLQIIAATTRLMQMLAQSAAACAPEAEETIRQMQKCAQKIMGAQAPGQQGPAPY